MGSYQKRKDFYNKKYGKLIRVKLFNDEVKEKRK